MHGKTSLRNLFFTLGVFLELWAYEFDPWSQAKTSTYWHESSVAPGDRQWPLDHTGAGPHF